MKTKEVIHTGLFLLLLLYHAYVLVDWSAVNTDIAQGVCCSTIGPIFEYIEHGQWEPKTSFFGLIGAYSAKYSLGLLPFQLCALTGVAFLFQSMRTHMDSFGSAVASISILGFPFFAYAIRKWDVYAASILITGLLFFLSLSKKRRLTWGNVLLVPVFAFWSPRTTDNLLLLSLLWSVVLFTKIRHRNTSNVVIVVMVVLTAWSVSQFQYSSPQGFGYYIQELSHNTAQTRYQEQIFAYASYIIRRGLGPWNSWIYIWLSPFVIYALRKKANRQWLWGSIPILLVLSLIPKKNHYYIFVLWPFLAIYLAVGLNTLPKMLRYPIGLYFLGMNLFPYVSKSNPDGTLAAHMGGRPWIYPMNTAVFQTYDGGLDIRPVKNRWAEQAMEILSPPMRCGYIIASYGGLETDEIQLRIPTACPRIHKVPNDNHLDISGMVLLSPARSRIKKSESLRDDGFVRQESIFDKERKEIWVFKRTKEWFENNTSER